ncbi:MAG: DNA mismatch repair endonuclease MutL, partial [Myxococcota bacterium]
MGKVKLLDDLLINKIAAGEVVERPASVVKELVENAIDAGAGRIDIEIEQGGKKLIRVVDDGCGMSEEDALMSLQRHATSKIKSEDDLFKILTMGFRGEAIPSIASVSRFQIETCIEEQESGVCVAIEGGKHQTVTPVGRAVGTTVEVRDLFFNIPARRKFLKTDGTEHAHIAETITRLALAHPEIRFRMTHNRRVHIQANATSDPCERISSLLGRQVGEAMYPFVVESPWLKLNGYFSKPDVTSQNTKGMYLFVNGRFIRHRGIAHACQEAYRGSIEKGRYPYIVMFLNVSPKEVDVNVHPQKIEVRFHRDSEVYNHVY